MAILESIKKIWHSIKRWTWHHVVVFLPTFFAYAAFHACRKAFSNIKDSLPKTWVLYVIYVTRLHLYFSCSLDYITRLLIYRYSIVSGGCLIHFRLCCLHRVIIHPETLVAEEKKQQKKNKQK